MPAKAGIHIVDFLGSRLRGSGEFGINQYFLNRRFMKYSEIQTPIGALL